VPEDVGSSAGDGASRTEAIEPAVVATALVGAFALRVLYLLHYRVDSDEPQHLHVAWGWAHGLVQYRQVFDNHAPLFHVLCAPLVRLVGERPDVVLVMRFAMLPLYVGSLAATYVIAAALFPARHAAWATAVAALAPGFFLNSVEFRADDLWAALWLIALAVIVRGRLTGRRATLVGLLLGATLATSLKTTLLLTSLTIAGAGALAVTPPSARASWRTLAGRIAAGLAGLLVVPTVVVLGFASLRALDPLVYGTISHNALPGLGLWHKTPQRILLLPLSVPLLGVGARLLARTAPTPEVGARRTLVFLAAGVYLVLLLGAWPLVTREDFIPVAPLVALLATSAGMSLVAAFSSPRRRGAWTMAMPMVAIVLATQAMLRSSPPWVDATGESTELVAAVLRLTTPDEYVMDLKGESVFRRRPYYYVLEYITKERLERGLLPDSIPEDLVATRTSVVAEDRNGIPPRGRAFMAANYLDIGPVRVLGRMLPDGDTAERRRAFEVVVPGRYAILAEHGTASGALDGVPYDGARWLAAGTHEFVPERDDHFALLWSKAVETGFVPFFDTGRTS